MQNRMIIRVGIIILICIMLFVLFSVVFRLCGAKEPIRLLPIIYIIFAFSVSFAGASLLRIKPGIFIVCIGALSFCAALCIALYAHTEPDSDFLLLHNLAVALENGGINALDTNEYFLRWAYQSFFVIYEAAVISIFPWGITPLLIFNAMFMAGITVLIYLFARHIFSEKAARFIAITYFFFPTPYLLSSVLTNQHISLFFLLLGIYIIMRKTGIKNIIIGGLLLSVGNALRPDGSIIIAAIALLVIISLPARKEEITRSIKNILPTAFTIISCLIFSMLISVIVTVSGVNPNGQKNSDPLWKLVIGLNAETKGGYSEELADAVFSIEDIAERHALESKIIHEQLYSRENLLVMLFEKTVMFWGDTEDIYLTFNIQAENKRIVPIINKPLYTVFTSIQQTERLYFATIIILGISSLGLVYIKKREIDTALILCGFVIAVFFGAYILIERQSRYRYFSYPFFILMTGGIIEKLMKFSKTNSKGVMS